MAMNLPGYELEKQVGMGAGSRIYRAVETTTGKRFAVKRVVKNRQSDERFFAQVENEFAVSSQIDHPNLRHSHLLHRVRKRFQVREMFLIMDYIDGLPIEIARPNRLNTFLNIFRKVTFGLDAMHEAGHIHSDIKPNNIMFGRGGVVKIIDFGQSCPIGHRKARVQGTPDFIAPEQVRRLSLDRRTDVYNLGATMYWVLTSEKFPTIMRAEGEPDGRAFITVDEPIAPIELNDRIPLALSNLVMECCEDHPSERPADMTQVRARIEKIQERWVKHCDEERSKLRATQPTSDEQNPSATEEVE